jgi:hypothetical protein
MASVNEVEAVRGPRPSTGTRGTRGRQYGVPLRGGVPGRARGSGERQCNAHHERRRASRRARRSERRERRGIESTCCPTRFICSPVAPSVTSSNRRSPCSRRPGSCSRGVAPKPEARKQIAHDEERDGPDDHRHPHGDSPGVRACSRYGANDHPVRLDGRLQSVLMADLPEDVDVVLHEDGSPARVPFDASPEGCDVGIGSASKARGTHVSACPSRPIRHDRERARCRRSVSQKMGSDAIGDAAGAPSGTSRQRDRGADVHGCGVGVPSVSQSDARSRPWPWSYRDCRRNRERQARATARVRRPETDERAQRPTRRTGTGRGDVVHVQVGRALDPRAFAASCGSATSAVQAREETARPAVPPATPRDESLPCVTAETIASGSVTAVHTRPREPPMFSYAP